MPAPADPFYVFHRIKGELMRLMYLDNMRATTEQLINGFTKMEPRYVEAHKLHVNEMQQALTKVKDKKTKPRELTDAEKRDAESAFMAARAAWEQGEPEDANPHDQATAPVLHNYWARGWRARAEGK